MNAISNDGRGNLVRLALPIVALMSLFGSWRAAVAAAADCERHAARASQVLFGPSLENWEPLNDRTVLVWTGRETRAHLVRLERPLDGLTDASIIVLVDGDHDLSISACGHDGIAIGEGEGQGRVARIVSIELLSYQRTLELDPGADGERPSFRT